MGCKTNSRDVNVFHVSPNQGLTCDGTYNLIQPWFAFSCSTHDYRSVDNLLGGLLEDQHVRCRAPLMSSLHLHVPRGWFCHGSRCICRLLALLDPVETC